jgi:hypothetical protein
MKKNFLDLVTWTVNENAASALGAAQRSNNQWHIRLDARGGCTSVYSVPGGGSGALHPARRAAGEKLRFT